MKTNIMGTAVATVQQMQSYIQKVNPAVPKSVIDMVEYYISEGKTEGVRGDIAFAQSCLETGNFTFNGSAVTLDQNNFAGIGVTKNGMKGIRSLIHGSASGHRSSILKHMHLTKNCTVYAWILVSVM